MRSAGNPYSFQIHLATPRYKNKVLYSQTQKIIIIRKMWARWRSLGMFRQPWAFQQEICPNLVFICNFHIKIQFITLYKLILKSITNKRGVSYSKGGKNWKSSYKIKMQVYNRQQKIQNSCGIPCYMMLCAKDFSSNNLFSWSLNPSRAVQYEGTEGVSGSPEAWNVRGLA